MKLNPLYVLYQWLIALPVALVLTAITAILTTILSPLLPNSQISYFPARWWGRLVCWIFFIRVHIKGLENIQADRSYVFIANHQSMFDIFTIYGWLPGIFKWIMKAELRKVPLVGKACETAGHIFIDRTNPVAAKISLDKAEKQLSNGVSVVIFPEGTRTKTGKMGKFKKGAYKLATDLQLPIVPMTIRGSFERVIQGTFQFTPGIIELIVHPPLVVSNSESDIQTLISQSYDLIQTAL